MTGDRSRNKLPSMLYGCALLALAASAAAAPLTIAVSVKDGKDTYSETVKAEIGKKGRFDRKTVGTLGKRRLFEFEYRPKIEPDGGIDLSFDLVLRQNKGGEGRNLVFNSLVYLRKAIPLVVLDCGTWKVEIRVGAPAGRPVEQDMEVDDGNLRIVTVLKDKDEVATCRQVVKPDEMTNVQDLTVTAPEVWHGVVLSHRLGAAQGITDAIEFDVKFRPKGREVLTFTGAEKAPYGERMTVPDTNGNFGLAIEFVGPASKM